MRGGDDNGQGKFVRCLGCRKTVFTAEFEENLRVCPLCGHHHRLDADARIEITFDPDSFEQRDEGLHTDDPLQFPDYADKYAAAQVKTGRKDSVVGGTAKLGGNPVSVAVADFAFMGGSMGVAAGEAIARTLERGADERIPVVIFCASGGARMQEGLLSLMQMAKTTGAAHKCREAGAPFIAVFTDPTMAGVLASYASVADVILAEPKALIGFAGTRVAAQAQVKKVPDDFQTAEFCKKHGMIDRIVERRDLRHELIQLTSLLGAGVRG